MRALIYRTPSLLGARGGLSVLELSLARSLISRSSRQFPRAIGSPMSARSGQISSTIVRFVAAEVGVAPVPASIARSLRDGVCYLDLAGTDVRATLPPCWRTDNANPALTAFLDLLPTVQFEPISAPE